MIQTEQLEQMEKTGYLDREFRLFHIKDQTKKTFPSITMIFTRL